MGEQEMTRRDKRRLARHLDNVAARKWRQRSTGLHGDSAVSSWAQERWVGLQREAHRLGLGELLMGECTRRQVIIQLNKEQAKICGVTLAEWACMTRQHRADLAELQQRAPSDLWTIYPAWHLREQLRRLDTARVPA